MDLRAQGLYSLLGFEFSGFRGWNLRGVGLRLCAV